MDKTMQTRKREGGTMEFWPKSVGERIAAFRNVVENKSYAKIDGCMIDLFSANYVVQVYDALNPINREKFMTLVAPKAVKVAFQLVK